MTDVAAYLLPWHVDRSDAVRRILLDPLAEQGVAVRVVTSSDPSPEPCALWVDRTPDTSTMRPGQRVIWVPMYSPSLPGKPTWRLPPGSFSVLAYSDAVADLARRFGHPFLRVTYYPEPDPSPTPTGGPVLLYWNRIGLLSTKDLRAIAQAVSASAVLYRNQPDGRQYAHTSRELPARLDGVEVRPLTIGTRNEYLAAVQQASVVIASRPYEGVGLSNLEAMAAGRVLFGVDAPALSEYVTHGETGFLFRHPGAIPSTARGVARRLSRHTTSRFGTGWSPAWIGRSHLRLDQLRSVDLERMAAAAHASVAAGRRTWEDEHVPTITEFVIGEGSGLRTRQHRS